MTKDPKNNYTVEQMRHWVRIADACNQRCLFCLDSDNHIGRLRTVEQCEAEFELGRKRGATRLIISGGEASIHPKFHYLIKRGIELGYDKVQTVTNGRMWAYPKFVNRAIAAGLSEVTFSMHGHTAKLHDRLVGVPGAFEQSLKGLKHCLSIRGLIVSVDIVLMKPNVALLPDIVRFYSDLGVGEYDLLAMIPFGRGTPNAIDHAVGMTRPADAKMAKRLLLDGGEIAAVMPEIRELAETRGLTIWTNRVKPQELEGCEYYLQRPKKLMDEVYGAKKEFQEALSKPEGWLPCADRCDFCFLQQMCDGFRGHRDSHYAGTIPHGWWRQEWGPIPTSVRFEKLTLEADSLTEAVDLCQAASLDGSVALDLSVDTVDTAALERMAGAYPQARVLAGAPATAEAVLDHDGANLVVMLNDETAAWFIDQPKPGVVFRPTNGHTGRKYSDVLPQLAGAGAVLEGFPECLFPAGHSQSDAHPRPYALGLHHFEDEIHGTTGWHLDRFVKSHLRSHYRVHSLRCDGCTKREECPGLHVKYVREGHGLSELDPSRFPARASSPSAPPSDRTAAPQAEAP